ncbi:MAG TPA: hypothetical protein VL308_15355 [Gemmatimonadaceae bacterium]|jgi:hypothetical protein|nr:hypothetical protein [Gemmatimonadaceae bacterium]
MWLQRSCVIAIAGSVLLPGAASSQAKVLSTVSPAQAAVTTAAGTISVNISSGAIQSLDGVIDNTPNNFPSTVGISLTWDLTPSTGAVQVIGYFSNPAVAMTSGPVSIPSSWIRGRVLTAGVQGAPTTFTAFTQTGAGSVGSAGGSLLLFSQPILGYSKAGTQAVDLQLQLDLTGRTLGAGSYSGTLNIRAVSQ